MDVGPADPFEQVIAVLSEPCWLVSLDGIVLGCNPGAASLVGRAAAELRGVPLAMMVRDPERLAGYLRICARNRAPIPGAFTFVRPDGSSEPVRCDGGVLQFAAGHRASVLLRCRPRRAAASRFIALSEQVQALNREVVRRRDAERVLRQQAELLEQAQDVIVVWRLDDGTVTYLNPAAEKLYGLVASQSLGQSRHRLEAPAVSRDAEKALRQTGRWSGEVAHIMRDARERLVELRMMLLPADDEPALVLETARDVTDARAERIRMEAAQRLEAVGRLAGGVAHEINNALQGVLGFSALALRALPPDSPARSDVQQALKAGERATVITQGLLAFSRRQVLQP
ncbi:MAG: PAS domain-containing protein, partial [Gemmatimonadota bacterium]|nr:PAS domain-containing protein [Gemmatimonadota bacterium]